MFFQSGTFTNREKWMRHLSINPPMIEAQECQHPGRNLVAFQVRNKNAWKCPLVPNHILVGNGFARDLLKCHPPSVIIFRSTNHQTNGERKKNPEATDI